MKSGALYVKSNVLGGAGASATVSFFGLHKASPPLVAVKAINDLGRFDKEVENYRILQACAVLVLLMMSLFSAGSTNLCDGAGLYPRAALLRQGGA